jgi:hypothetical protein
VIVGGSGGILEHEGEARKVRGIATWLEGLLGWRSLEGGGEYGGSSDNPGEAAALRLARVDRR